MKFYNAAAALIALSIPAAAPVFGQFEAKALLPEGSMLSSAVPVNAKTDVTPTVPAASVMPQESPSGPKIARWVDVKELNFSFRYRSEKGTDDYTYFANGQERSIVDGRLKLDADARYTLDFRVSSGRMFNWAYSDVINPDFLDREGPASLVKVPLQQLEKLGELLALGYPIPPVPSRGWEMSPRLLYL